MLYNRLIQISVSLELWDQLKIYSFEAEDFHYLQSILEDCAKGREYLKFLWCTYGKHGY